MGEWKPVTLQAVTTVLGDGLHGTPIYDDQGEYYFINGNNLGNGRISLKQETRRVGVEEYEKYKKELNERTILVSINGTLGNIALYDGEPCILGKSACYFNIDRAVDRLYVKYVLMDKRFQSYIHEYSTGTTIKNMPLKAMREFAFELPDPPEQRAIASVLSSLDAKIDLLHRQNKTLEAMAETLYRQWFVERCPEDLEGEAEEGWVAVPLGEFGMIVCGKTPSKKIHDYHNGSIPFIRIPDMHGQVYLTYSSDSITEKGQASQSNKTLPLGSICVSCIATVGLVSITTRECQTNQQINSIIPSKEHYRYYLYLLMLNQYEDLHAMASGGTATLNLNTSNFKSMLVSAPPDKVLRDFHQVVAPLFGRMRHNYDQLTTLTNLRDTLLPKLMSGEVRVEQKDLMR